MQKIAKKLSLVMVALLTVFTALSYMPAKAAVVVPKVQYVSSPKLEYTAGDRVQFNLNAPNYGGRVQYRVVLWDNNNKQMRDLWPTGDRYYTNWMPYGNETFTLGWPISEPGTYRITIYAKRAGVANNKTALKGQNSDSYMESAAFVVKSATATVESIAPVANVAVEQGTTPVLPTDVTLNMSDKTTKTAKVTWAAVDTSKVGTVAVEGTVVGTDKKATVNVVVSAEGFTVSSVAAIANNKVNVSFQDAIKFVPSTSKFVVKDAAAKVVNVKSAVLNADGKTVTLTTDALTAYAVYTVTAGDVTKTFVALPADSVKPTASAVVTSNNEVTVTFSEVVNKTLAENVANYTIDNNLSVLKAELDSTGKVVTLTTSSQAVGTIYKVTVQNVADLSDNLMDKYEVLFGGMAKDTTKPAAPTAVVTGNTTVQVTFNEAVDKTLAENIANYAIDNSLVVLKAELDSDVNSGTYMKKVTLTTSAQTVGTIYKVTVQNVADVAGNVMDKFEGLFGGMSKDTTKPAAPSVVSSANNKVTVVFAEDMDKLTAENIANYTVDNGLVVVKAELGTNKRTVTLTTSAQTVGTLYKATVQNVADIAGNVMDKYEGLFAGMAKDTTAPVVNSVVAAANTVTITYSEKVDKDSATNVLNYVFDGSLGYATKATLDTDATGTIVTLTTAAQTPGKIYNVTINGVRDLAGNTVTADTKKALVGVGSVSTSAVNVQTISIVNENTLDVVFDKELTTTDVTNLVIKINKDNGAAYAEPTGLAYSKVQQANKAVVRIQFKTTASTSPALFAAGHVYEATVTGVANLVIADSANVKNFAGTNVTNPAPYVAAATALNKTAVKVVFSEPVTNVTAASFAIDNGITVTGVSVAAGDKVTEATLYLNQALADSTVYTMTFSGAVASVKDAAGYVDMKILNADTTVYNVKFAGINVVNAAPKMVAVIPVDKYNFDIIFSEPVVNAATATYTVTKTSGTGLDLKLTGETYVLSEDGTKLSVKLDSVVDALVSGTVYELVYTGSIVDKQGLAYDTTVGANKVNFAGLDTVNSLPEIAAVEAVVGASDTTITVVFSEEITGYTTNANFFDITVEGTPVTLTAGTIAADNKTITLTVPKVAVGKAGSIKINADGAAAIVDANNQAPKTDAVAFGTK